MKKLLIAMTMMAVVICSSLTASAEGGGPDCTTPTGCVSKGLNKTITSDSNTTLGDIIANITKVLLFLMGAVSVIMIIIGGFRYATSQGDQTQMQSAKNTILYAVIGLIVAIAAYAIVSFVVTQFIEAPATPVAT